MTEIRKVGADPTMLASWPLGTRHPLVKRPMQCPGDVFGIAEVDSLEERDVKQRKPILQQTTHIDDIHIYQVPFSKIDELDMFQIWEVLK